MSFSTWTEPISAEREQLQPTTRTNIPVVRRYLPHLSYDELKTLAWISNCDLTTCQRPKETVEDSVEYIISYEDALSPKSRIVTTQDWSNHSRDVDQAAKAVIQGKMGLYEAMRRYVHPYR